MAVKTTVLNVEGMSCNHCVAAVKKAVSALPGVTKVDVNLAGKTATVEHDDDRAPVAALRAAIEEQGYDVKA